jgi:hypothetical protein
MKEDVWKRQKELIEVLRRNAIHSNVYKLHILLGEHEPVQLLLSNRTNWYKMYESKILCSVLKRRPHFSDFLKYMYENINDKLPIILVNQDVFLSSKIPRLDGITSSYFLSRTHHKYSYRDIDKKILCVIISGYLIELESVKHQAMREI